MPRKLTPEQREQRFDEKLLRRDAKKDPEGVYLRLLRRFLTNYIEEGALDCGATPDKYANDMEEDCDWWQLVYEGARYYVARSWPERYKLPELSVAESIFLIDRVFSGEMRSWKNGVKLGT